MSESVILYFPNTNPISFPKSDISPLLYGILDNRPMINNRFNVVYHLLCVVILWLGLKIYIFIYKEKL